jgi:hypothetical protein
MGSGNGDDRTVGRAARMDRMRMRTAVVSGWAGVSGMVGGVAVAAWNLVNSRVLVVRWRLFLLD